MATAPSSKRLLSLLMIAVAVVLILSGGWLIYNDARTTYQLRITQTHDASPDSEAIAYEELPPEAKTAFQKARSGELQTHHKPSYLETFPLATLVDVRRKGTVYEMWATKHGFSGASLHLAVPMALFGAILGPLGLWLHYRNSATTAI